MTTNKIKQTKTPSKIRTNYILKDKERKTQKETMDCRDATLKIEKRKKKIKEGDNKK